MTAGDDAGKTPHKVVQVLASGAKLMVEGVNRVHKHVRRGHPKSPQGGRLHVEMPIDASNAQFYCGTCSKGVRLGYRYTTDGSKERFCKSCKESQGTLSGPKTNYAANS